MPHREPALANLCAEGTQLQGGRRAPALHADPRGSPGSQPHVAAARPCPRSTGRQQGAWGSRVVWMLSDRARSQVLWCWGCSSYLLRWLPLVLGTGRVEIMNKLTASNENNMGASGFFMAVSHPPSAEPMPHPNCAPLFYPSQKIT